MADVFVGIDLGTTTTLIAKAMEVNGSIYVSVLDIKQDQDIPMKYLPSLAYFPIGKPPFVGRDAQLAGEQDTTRLVRAVKRQMGRRLVIPEAGELPYKISALYLQKALEAANYQMIGDFVFTVTVPASFTSNQRADTLKALKLACENQAIEFPKKNPGQIFISEPVAAMLAFINKEIEKSAELRRLDLDKENWLVVYDIGGGTCDLTLVFIDPKHKSVNSMADITIQVKAISYYNPFGGENFDELVAKELLRRLMEAIPQLQSITLTEAERSSVRLQLMNLAKKIKETLSTQECDRADDQAASELFGEEEEENSYFYHDSVRIKGKGYSLEGTMTWKEFVQAVEPLFSGPSRKSLITPLADLLNRNKREPEKLDGLLIVGGMGRLPIVEQKLKEYWGNNQVWVYQPPDHAVVTGAAIYSYLRKSCPGFILKEPAADSYYVRTEEGFDPILPSMDREGTTKRYKLNSSSDKLVLQLFAGEEPEPNKLIETIYPTLIHQGGTTIKLGKEYPKDTPVWIQMRFDGQGEEQNHTKVPWVYVWIDVFNEEKPNYRFLYTDLIQDDLKEDHHVQSI